MINDIFIQLHVICLGNENKHVVFSGQEKIDTDEFLTNCDREQFYIWLRAPYCVYKYCM